MAYRKLFFCILICSISGLYQTHAKNKYYPREAIAEMTDSLFRAIEKMHPDMYVFTPRNVFRERIEEMKKSLPDSLSAYEWYGRLAPVVALIGEGHTTIDLPMESYYDHNPYLLEEWPYIEAEEMKLYLKDLRKGIYRIISINGRTNREIVDKLLSYSVWETIPGKVWFINALMPYIWHFIDPSDTYRIEYLDSRGKPHQATLKGVRVKYLEQKRGERDKHGKLIESKDEAGSRFSFSKINTSTVLFNFPLFDEKAIPVIDSLFKYLNSDPAAENLIIDLRNNRGGSSLVYEHLLGYVSPGGFPGFIQGRDSVGYEWKSPLPDEKRFHGNLYVLINNGSYSAAVLFAHAVKEAKAGILVGEQTGGSIFTHGNPTSLTLSCKENPVITINISTALYPNPRNDYYKQTMEAVTPDVRISDSRALAEVLKIIAATKKP